MAMRGSGGKMDSSIASRIGTNGPSPSKPSNNASQNSSVPSWWSQSMSVVSIVLVPSLSFLPDVSS